MQNGMTSKLPMSRRPTNLPRSTTHTRELQRGGTVMFAYRNGRGIIGAIVRFLPAHAHPRHR
ncbi:hypothetical protein SAMN05444748_101699 [Variovorax sp. OV700]|nr:hypothetical protein SAMN05444748_101699 [Variovorax sp. OV700]